jgi:hypothetical protein
MTECHISSIDCGSDDLLMPSIIHHRLKFLSLPCCYYVGVAPTIMGALTLPCLQEFHTEDVIFIANLPALVHRSSCPLTKLTFCLHIDEVDGDIYLSGIEPMPSVTELFLETQQDNSASVFEKLLLEGYFPNLRHLTLQLQPFLSMWGVGTIRLLLDNRRLRPDEPNEGRLPKILVVEKDQADKFDEMWNSNVGMQLQALDIHLREDGFEFL